MNEAALHQNICDYLHLQHRGVLFRTDFAAGIKMTIGQAARHKRLQQSRAYPDLTIIKACRGYHGCFIELKREGAGTFLKDGSLSKTAHVQEQAQMLVALTKEGYYAVFAEGFDQAKAVIDWYLGKTDKLDLRPFNPAVTERYGTIPKRLVPAFPDHAGWAKSF